ncbi:hypothetical protein F8388_004312 [Cannabis sativa]|uniref:Uncharacterized protein n=1 Tax=Cannabis sativa TaxID=3483 RepID=A0A7J6H9L8_CANSA|nr:hypothetical protein F8388_004312 [Cannabis sativa]
MEINPKRIVLSVELVGDGKDVWIFDIDEILFSNLPFYADHGYGFRQIPGGLSSSSVAIGGCLNE